MAAQERRPDAQALISLATQAVFLSLHQSGLVFAFSGSVAQTIYGEAHHLPEKIEVSLFSPVASIPELKQALAQTHPAWFTYHMLSRRLRYLNLTLAAQNGGLSEIEIVLVSTSGSSAYLTRLNNLPVVPYSFILLRELMFWDNTSPTHLQSRHSRGAHILHMLNVLRRRIDIVHYSEFDEQMQAASVERVARFFAAHPSFRKEWQRIGLMPHRDRAAAGEKPYRGSHNAGDASTVPAFVPKDDLVTSLETMVLTPDHSALPLVTSTSTSTSPAHLAQPESTSPSKRKTKLSRLQIRRMAARTTVETFKAHNFDCALFGSMACKLYGNKRIPNDIDVLVLPREDQMLDGVAPTQESLKDLLVASAPESFVLRPARDPEAIYRVLYFLPTPTSKPTPHHSSKVDILLPGVMHLPALLPSTAPLRNNIIATVSPTIRGARSSSGSEPESQVPVLPFCVLLLQKLQGWDDHRTAEEARYKEKAPVDVDDLEWMLGVGAPRYLRVDARKGAMIWRDRTLFDEEFEALSKRRVVEFCNIYPRWTEIWRGLGFEVT
ncbi:hypothetical protein H0H87_000244 [Tephrocybe sp. NHM501043]|nr:hypothetical protein H0H87_000244 [Tephrocybe sp. NHM501043]